MEILEAYDLRGIAGSGIAAGVITGTARIGSRCATRESGMQSEVQQRPARTGSRRRSISWRIARTRSTR